MLHKSFFGIGILILIFIVGCTQPTSGTTTLEIVLNPGVDTVEVNSTFIDAGVTATLNGKNHAYVVLENTVDISLVGTYQIVYQTTSGDHIQTIKRIISVVDETPPVIVLNPGVDTIFVNDAWSDAGVSVSDNSALSVTIEIYGDVTVSMAGEYQITYRATDAYGNQSEITRYVNVIER